MLFLIIAAFTAGFLDAIVGGGGMISLPSLLALGLPPNIALGSNKLIGISTALASSTKYIHSKSVKWQGMKLGITLSLIGSMIGVLLISTFSNETLKHLIFYLLIAIVIFLLVNKKFGLMERKKSWPIQYLWIVCLVVGMYDGFFGPGTGTFLVIAFVHMFGYGFLPAAATGRILNLASNVGALIVFFSLGWVDFQFVFPGMIAAFIGGLLGASYSVKFGAKGIRPIMFLVVIALIVKLGIQVY
ncbi:MAG: TSUP family transporter [Bdellovibrionota bacterium]